MAQFPNLLSGGGGDTLKEDDCKISIEEDKFTQT